MDLFDSPAIRLEQSEHENGAKITASFSATADFSAFRGHFPGNPILPGIAQIALITEILNRRQTAGVILNMIRRVKFLAPVMPEMNVEIELVLDYSGPLLNADAVLTSAGKKISVLKLSYQEMPE